MLHMLMQEYSPGTVSTVPREEIAGSWAVLTFQLLHSADSGDDLDHLMFPGRKFHRMHVDTAAAD
jgi:hypothetical protein